MSFLEIAAVVFSALGVWLTARRNPLCWPVGLVSVALYGWIFFGYKLYSDMLLQGVFAALQLYGWQRWWSGARDEGGVVVEHLPLQRQLAGLAIGALGGVLLGYAMLSYTDASFPWLDAALAGFSLVAQVWMARKYVACWWLWIVVDVVYVGMYLAKDLYLTAGLYAGFVVLAALGWRSWQQAVRQSAVRANLSPQAA